MNSRLALTIFASLAVHAAGAFWFFYVRPVVQASGKKGVVSVSFIQLVSHDPSELPAFRKKKGPPSPEPKPSAEVSPVNTENQSGAQTQGEAGDPQAIAKESDLFIAAVTQMIEK